MARRRVVYPVDTSDRLANVVLGSLVVGVIALIVLLVLLNNDDDTPSAQEGATGASGVVTVVPSPSAPTDAEQPTSQGQPTGGPVGGAEATGAGGPPSPEPLRPRGARTEPGPTTAPGGAPPPVVAPTPEALVPEEATPEEATPDAVAPSEPADWDVLDVPESPLDDPDRVPRLVVSDTPTDAHTVIIDLNGDGILEGVWAALVRNTVHVRVYRYAESGWVDPPAASAVGADADDLVRLSVEDVTGDGRPDIHTKQWVGVNGESVSLWSFTDGRLRAMTASGGCWDGENTYGLVGARVDFGQVLAICEEDPLPPYLWSTAVYRWVDGMWTFQQRVGVYG